MPGLNRLSAVLGLDLGTTTITGVLWEPCRCEVLRVASRPNDSALPVERPARAEQDPARIRARAMEVLAELAAAGVPVEGIGLAGQMHGLLCVDDSNGPLTPLISWQDRRTAEPLPGGGTLLDEVQRRTAGLAWQENGCRIEHGYGAATLFWLVRNGLLPLGAARACTLPGWLAGNLAGCPAATDPTLAASWGVSRLPGGPWNRAFLECLALDVRLFPAIRPGGQVVGGLVPDIAHRVGLPAGTPVCQLIGDQQAAFLSSVAGPERAVLVNLGTGGQVAWAVPGSEPATERAELRPLPDGSLLRVGASPCGGAAYTWLNRTVRRWLAEFGLGLGTEAVHDRLNGLAAGAPDAAGLRVRTTFLGVRGDPSVRGGAVEGLTPDNLSLGALARATLLGMVDELLEIYRAHGGPAAGHQVLVAGGNAVQKTPLLPALLGERFGLSVRVSPWAEPAAVGAAMAARL